MERYESERELMQVDCDAKTGILTHSESIAEDWKKEDRRGAILWSNQPGRFREGVTTGDCKGGLFNDIGKHKRVHKKKDLQSLLKQRHLTREKHRGMTYISGTKTGPELVELVRREEIEEYSKHKLGSTRKSPSNSVGNIHGGTSHRSYMGRLQQM